MKILIDMNLSPRWCAFLADAGHNAVHWSVVGERAASDESIMAFARDNGFIVLTHDLDFGAILAASGTAGPSVVQIRSDILDPKVIGEALGVALRQAETELSEGALLVVEPGLMRLRLLPLRGE